MARTDHIDAITGLRAIAVMAVVLFHIDAAWLPGGFVGVDVFFVISGFVVAHSVLTYRVETHRAFLAEFYRRRLARLMPAAIVYVVTATLATLLFVPYLASTASFEIAGAAAIVGLGNFMLSSTGGYFGVASHFHPFTHTWSLAVEEQYYLLFSLFAFALLKRPGARSSRWMLGAVIAATLASLIAAAVLTTRMPSFAFYMLPTRFWELAIGLLLRMALDARIGSALARVRPAWIEATAWLSLAVLMWSCAATSEKSFPWPGALAPCLATAGLIAAFWTRRDGRLARLLASPLPVWIGLISYSMYLWHWGILVFMRWTVGVDTLPLKLIALAATFGFAAASYYGVERRFQRLHARASSSPDYFLRFAGVVAMVVTLCFVAGPMRPSVGLARASDLEQWNPYGAPAAVRSCEAEIEKREWGNGLAIVFHAPCRKADAPTLYVLGDSHAGAYQRMLWKLAETGEWDVRLYTLNGCSPVNLRPLRLDEYCNAFLRRATAEIRAGAGADDIVFLPALHMPLRRDAWGYDRVEEYGDRITPATLAVSRARLNDLAALPATLVIENTKPVMPAALFRCADWFNRNQAYCRYGSSVSRAEMLARARPIRAGLVQLTASLPHAVLWDPMAALCRGPSCQGFSGGQPLYFDTDHLSAHGNDVLLPYFRAELGRLQRGSRLALNHK